MVQVEKVADWRRDHRATGHGYATTKKIRKLYPNAPLPVITLSEDDSDEATVKSTFGCGANDLVIKPISKQNLMTRIGAQLKTLHFWRGQLELTRSEHLLKEMLPESIINRLKEGERSISDEHEAVTIIFTDIVSFTSLSATHPIQDVIQMLDTLFSEFDKLTDKYGIYKVETIGGKNISNCAVTPCLISLILIFFLPDN